MNVSISVIGTVTDSAIAQIRQEIKGIVHHLWVTLLTMIIAPLRVKTKGTALRGATHRMGDIVGTTAPSLLMTPEIKE
jgi:hypothetical protein